MPRTATQEQHQQAEQGGHRLAAQGQSAQELHQHEQEDGDVERRAVENGSDGTDKSDDA